MLRVVLVAFVFLAPAAQAADLAIRLVVVKSARVSVQGPQVVVKTSSREDVQVTVDSADRRIVLTP